MRLHLAVSFAAALALVGAPAIAHHSGAMYDRARTIVLKGTLKSYEFVAPHSWLSVIAAPDGKGKAKRWDVEGASASRMARQGITPDRLKPGDKLTVRMHPLRDGRAGGTLIDITLADGTLFTNDPTRLPVGQ